jgi:UDP-glucuronate 4-epimerase
VLDKPPAAPGHRLYNLGSAGSEDIAHIIELFEKAFDKKAVVELHPGEPGDMLETAADITDTSRDFGWTPKVPVEEGIPRFVEWFKAYNRL